MFFFAAGVYDLRTPVGRTRYNIHHNGLDHSRIMEREYESGHMPYFGEDSCEALEQDMKVYIERTLKQKKCQVPYETRHIAAARAWLRFQERRKEI